MIYVLLPKRVKRPRITNPQLDITWASGESYAQGMEEHIIGGVTVQITSAAKTVADCFKYRTKVGIAVAAEALRDAWQQKQATSAELWQTTRAYAWGIWKMGAMTSERKLAGRPARLRLERIEPFSGWSRSTLSLLQNPEFIWICDGWLT